MAGQDAPARRRRRWRRLGLAALAAAAFLFALDRAFPPPRPDGGGATVVLAADGTPLRAFAGADGVWRYPVAIGDVSPLYLEALLGYEDRWFRWHPGVNPVAWLRAGGQWLANGRIVSGGSTLTMQVARILEPQPRSLGGKLRQSLRALQLELRYSKDEILAIYLNHAPFGGTVEGVEAASWAYLGKPASRLSRAEAALLAVLPQAPSRLRPDRHPAAAQAARDKVLSRLVAMGDWTPDQVEDARLEPVVARRLQPPVSAPLLAERLRQAAPGAARITSTVDGALQRALEDRLGAWAARLPPRTSAAVLVVENDTLAARAYVGALAFGDAERLGHVDMVRATRSPGSTLKPFLYGLAIDDGLVHSGSLLVDAPMGFGDYRPANFDPSFNGPVAVDEALRLSLNVPAVDLLDRVGPARFAARLAHAGVTLRFPRGSPPNLSLILGGTGTSLEELVGAYAALNRGGLAGAVRYTPDAPPDGRRLLSPEAAWIIRDVLEAAGRPGEREELFERGGRPRIAFKTGTSYGFRDAWAIGSTARHTVASGSAGRTARRCPGSTARSPRCPCWSRWWTACRASPATAAGAHRLRACARRRSAGRSGCRRTPRRPRSASAGARPGRWRACCRRPCPIARRGPGGRGGWCWPRMPTPASACRPNAGVRIAGRPARSPAGRCSPRPGCRRRSGARARFPRWPRTARRTRWRRWRPCASKARRRAARSRGRRARPPRRCCACAPSARVSVCAGW